MSLSNAIIEIITCDSGARATVLRQCTDYMCLLSFLLLNCVEKILQRQFLLSIVTQC